MVELEDKEGARIWLALAKYTGLYFSVWVCFTSSVAVHVEVQNNLKLACCYKDASLKHFVCSGIHCPHCHLMPYHNLFHIAQHKAAFCTSAKAELRRRQKAIVSETRARCFTVTTHNVKNSQSRADSHLWCNEDIDDAWTEIFLAVSAVVSLNEIRITWCEICYHHQIDFIVAPPIINVCFKTSKGGRGEREVGFEGGELRNVRWIFCTASQPVHVMWQRVLAQAHLKRSSKTHKELPRHFKATLLKHNQDVAHWDSCTTDKLMVKTDAFKIVNNL